ncbi:MAG: valine--tRNA ligase [Candidatus Nanosyncoccaceae bacterium]|jgi:valyl-tRNA synthetase
MDLAKTYQPENFEPTIYAMWEAGNAFSPRGEGKPYSIVMPPPNANGNLHIGHALTVNLQDILVRYYRMQGRRTVYIPGADHAGFETWVVFEKELNKQGKTRLEFSREELYQKVWNFVAEKRGDMELQLRSLGASCSWDDLVFTLDAKVIETVYSTFKKLWDEDLIYRGKRMVNYSTKYQTSYADIEVNHKEVEGVLYNIAYQLSDDMGEIVVATTRPETILGDVAVAVNPKDERYSKFIGKHAFVPIVDREVPIIADNYVDMKYGTGVVKITPAHDANDFEVGKRHKLEPIQVIDYDGKMINSPSSLNGLTTEEARKKTLAILESLELRRGEKKIKHVVGFDYKSGWPIEPMIKEQWFLRVRPLAERAKQAIMSNQIRFYPANKKQVIIRYLDNLRDWNLSRQIAWGIPIPAFQNVDDPDDWIFDTRVNQERIEIDGQTYQREEDTFDTWFSSGQWPYVVTDYLNKGKLAEFYPTDLMETGFDLIDRWVARMIMLGLYSTNQVPFREVYMHGMVLDEHGQKMSKSKGNVINPIEIIGKYGSDALRLGIIANRSAGQNQAFALSNVIAGRNFCNKLWNIARYVFALLPEDFKPIESKKIPLQSEADHWIIDRLDRAIKQINQHISKYRFSEAGEVVYQTIWNDVADWYLEVSKKQTNHQLLAYVLDTILKIAHPFAPFITEAIWQSANWHSNELLILQRYPEPKTVSFSTEHSANFEEIRRIVEETRFLLKELPSKRKYDLVHQRNDLMINNEPIIKHLTGINDVRSVSNPSGIRISNTGHQVWLEVDAKTLYEHQANLEVRLLEARSRATNLQARLDNPNYTKKAPKHLVIETKTELATTLNLIKRLEEQVETK